MWKDFQVLLNNIVFFFVCGVSTDTYLKLLSIAVKICPFTSIDRLLCFLFCLFLLLHLFFWHEFAKNSNCFNAKFHQNAWVRAIRYCCLPMVCIYFYFFVRHAHIFQIWMRSMSNTIYNPHCLFACHYNRWRFGVGNFTLCLSHDDISVKIT